MGILKVITSNCRRGGEDLGFRKQKGRIESDLQASSFLQREVDIRAASERTCVADPRILGWQTMLRERS